MNPPNTYGSKSLDLFPAFRVGLMDGFNIYNFSTILVFIIFLSFLGTTPKRVFLFGLFFCLMALWVQWESAAGTLDQMLSSVLVLSIIRIGYLCIALIFLVLGFIDFSDWRRAKSGKGQDSFKGYIPVFFQNLKVSKENRAMKISFVWVGLFVLGISLSGVLTVMALNYPQSEYIFIVHSFLMSGGDQVFAFRSFFLYGLAMTLPLIIAWLLIIWLVSKKNNNERNIIFYKLVLSALFLSIGMGLGYYILMGSHL